MCSVCDLNEAYQCICELFHPSTISLFVSVAYDTVLEKSGKAKESIGKLLSELVRYVGTVKHCIYVRYVLIIAIFIILTVPYRYHRTFLCTVLYLPAYLPTV